MRDSCKFIGLLRERRPTPHCLSRLQAVAELSDGELDALVGQATVDAYDQYEQLTSCHVMIGERLLPSHSGPPSLALR